MKKMLRLYVSIALMACGVARAETTKFEYPTQADILKECQQAISLTDNVEFFESLCGTRIFNIFQSLSFAYQSVPMQGDETTENSIVCHYHDLDQYNPRRLQEFIVASRMVDYLSTRTNEERSASAHYHMADIIKTLYAPPCYYPKTSKKVIFKNSISITKQKPINNELPTQEDIVSDCKNAIAIGDGKEFLVSRCAARINSVLGGYSLVAGKKVDMKLCVPKNYFSGTQSAEYKIAKDIINFFSKDSIKRGSGDEPFLFAKGMYAMYEDKCNQ